MNKHQINNSVKILENVKKLFSKDGSWIRGSYALDDEGRQVSIGNRKACKFCLSGALWRIISEHNTYYIISKVILDCSVVKSSLSDNIVSLNDDILIRRSQVIKLLDKAIVKVKEDGHEYEL